MSNADAGSDRNPIIVFDAICVLCSANAQFVLKHDKKHCFKLAAMQGEAGTRLYKKFGINPSDPESLIVVDGDQCLRDSDAVLSIYSGLGWPWRAASVFRLCPRSVRDPIYRWIARNRYRIFGQRDTCWVPDPQFAERIL